MSTQIVTVTDKGCHGINTVAESQGEKLFIFVMVGQAAHEDCREKYANEREIALHLKKKCKFNTQENEKEMFEV